MFCLSSFVVLLCALKQGLAQDLRLSLPQFRCTRYRSVMCDAESQVFAPQQEVLPVDSQPLEETLVESLPVDSQPLGDSVRLSQPIGDSLRLSQPLEETPTVLSALPTTPPTFTQDWNRMHVPVLMPQAHDQDDFVKIVMSSLELGHNVSLDLEAHRPLATALCKHQ